MESIVSGAHRQNRMAQIVKRIVIVSLLFMPVLQFDGAASGGDSRVSNANVDELRISTASGSERSIPNQPSDGAALATARGTDLSWQARTAATSQKYDAGARAAFQEAYKVFMSPRCMNCHPAGDVPLQGEDSRPHAQNVKRGRDGKGKYALKCANCHQATNLLGENMPPGNPNWHLPPSTMRMVFEGKSPGDLCRQLKDPRQNGGKTLEQLIHHVSEDKLVLWGWNPGDGRAKPPLSHAEFAQKMREWISKGAACP